MDEPESRAVGYMDAKVVERAAKLITFSDLCGHEKYFKTTLMGMVGLNPDYLLCTLDANRGEMRGMVHEHLIVANALAIPTIVCLTKCDMAADRPQATLDDLKRFLKQMDTRAFLIKDKQDVVVAAERILQGFMPVVMCSAVSGMMISELKLLLNLLAKRTGQAGIARNNQDLLVHVEDVYPQVPGVGLVVSGRVVQGSVQVGDNVRLGPVIAHETGSLVKDGFVEVRINSMRFEDVPTSRLLQGTVGTFALKATGKNKILLEGNRDLVSKSGKVLLGKRSRLQPAMWAKATVTILQHPSSIRLGYEPVLHVGMIRQAARIMAMHTIDTGLPIKTLRAGEAALVLFRWTRRPEVVLEGSALIFRENLVKGIGSINWVGEPDGKLIKTAPGVSLPKDGKKQITKAQIAPKAPEVGKVKKTTRAGKRMSGQNEKSTRKGDPPQGKRSKASGKRKR